MVLTGAPVKLAILGGWKKHTPVELAILSGWKKHTPVELAILGEKHTPVKLAILGGEKHSRSLFVVSLKLPYRSWVCLI